ncbi:MAG: hypothetical protein ACK5NT_13875 [Pyrinomonadaceae bacterium]
MIRKFISKIRGSVDSRSVAKRREHHLPVRITFAPDYVTGNLNKSFLTLSIHGETSDLSMTGIGFIVTSIRLKEYYLVGEGRTLNAEITLPDGKITMQVIGTRYEQLGTSVSDSMYLVGAKILEISSRDKDIYSLFLEQRKNHRKMLELGIDGG